MKTTRFEILNALIISVLLCNSCKNDNGFTIEGKISNCQNCNIVLEKLSPIKIDTVANRRLAFARTRSAATVGKLFTVLGPRYKERNGGYLRVLKAGFRAGDAAPMAYVELVDREVK